LDKIFYAAADQYSFHIQTAERASCLIHVIIRERGSSYERLVCHEYSLHGLRRPAVLRGSIRFFELYRTAFDQEHRIGLFEISFDDDIDAIEDQGERIGKSS
jgi:hypothetical protein